MFIYYRRGRGSKSGGSAEIIEGREGGVRKNCTSLGGSTKMILTDSEYNWNLCLNFGNLKLLDSLRFPLF